MKTKTYDLNLYVINGQLKVLAHELQVSPNRTIQTNGSVYHEAIVIDLFRGNEPLWRNFLDYFGERDLYSELDSWRLADLPELDMPAYFYTHEQLMSMPIELARALGELPSYELAL